MGTKFDALDLRKMRKVDINLEKRSVTAQGGCIAADLEKPLEGNLSISAFMGTVS